MPAIPEMAFIQRIQLLAIADQKQSDHAGYSSTIAKIADDDFLSDEQKLDEVIKHTKGFIENIVLHKSHPLKTDIKKQLALMDAFDAKTFEPKMSLDKKAEHLMKVCIDLHVDSNIKADITKMQFKSRLHKAVDRKEDSQKEILMMCQNVKLTKMLFDLIDSACTSVGTKEKCKHTLMYGVIAESLDRPFVMHEALQKHLKHGLAKEISIENYKRFEHLTKVIADVCDEKKQDKLKSELVAMTDALKQQCARGEVKSEDAYQHTWDTLESILKEQSKKKSGGFTLFQPSVSPVVTAISSILKTPELAEVQHEFFITSPKNKSPDSKKPSVR